MKFEKIVTYKNTKYYVRCDVSGNLEGIVEYSRFEPVNDFYERKMTGMLNAFGKNLIEIVSNIIKKYHTEEISFLEWDGIIE